MYSSNFDGTSSFRFPRLTTRGPFDANGFLFPLLVSPSFRAYGRRAAIRPPAMLLSRFLINVVSGLKKQKNNQFIGKRLNKRNRTQKGEPSSDEKQARIGKERN